MLLLLRFSLLLWLCLRLRRSRVELPPRIALGQKFQWRVVDVRRAAGRVEDDVVLGFGFGGEEGGVGFHAEGFAGAAEGGLVAAAGVADPVR